ncbi:hypothetical protein GOODEAATRI_024289, partial [Goodea atripinnis]
IQESELSKPFERLEYTRTSMPRRFCVVANHLVNGIYTSFGLVVKEDCFCFFFRLAVFIHHLAVVYCAEKQNSLSLFFDIGDHGHAAIEPKFSAVDLPRLGSLHHWRDLWLVLSQ